MKICLKIRIFPYEFVNNCCSCNQLFVLIMELITSDLKIDLSDILSDSHFMLKIF
jgi:hypothetical protein